MARHAGMARRKEDEMSKATREFLTTLIFILAGLGLALFCNRFLVQKVTVEGSSMEQTLSNKDVLFGLRRGILYRTPDRYDVVVLAMPREVCYVKRIYGLPGENIRIEGDRIFIDEQEIEDPFASSPMLTGGIAQIGLELGEDEYFVLGDNRSVSLDSRDPNVGIVHKSQIMSRLALRVWPLRKMGGIR